MIPPPVQGGKNVKYINIPSVARPVSRIVLGASGPRFASGGDVSDLMEAALACGINAVDTARQYGLSEQAIGRWLRRGGNRDSMVLISKCCHPSHAFLARVNEKAAAEDLARSLEALNTDRIDVYLLHRDNEAVPVGRIVDFLNRFHAEGKIGAFGGSNWRAERIAQANEYAAKNGLLGFAVSSPHFSLGLQRHDPWGNGCRTVTGGRNAAQRQFYRDTQMPILAWSSLCGGLFSGKLKAGEWDRLRKRLGWRAQWAYGSPDNRERLARCEALAKEKDASTAQIVLAWLLGGDLNVLPVIGASGADRIAENAAAADVELSENERNWLDLVSEERTPKQDA